MESCFCFYTFVIQSSLVKEYESEKFLTQSTLRSRKVPQSLLISNFSAALYVELCVLCG